jgi:hypothetical protein
MTSAWRKSSYSGGNTGSCVETATVTDAVLIRDTTDRAGFTLSVSSAAWAAFLVTIRS